MTDPIPPAPDALLIHTASIVSAFVGQNAVPQDDLQVLIRSTYTTLQELASPVPPVVATAPIALPRGVTVESSVTPGGIVSLIDGRTYKSLRRHLTKHGFTPASYRAAYGLAADYPMVCSDYSATRSVMAKEVGLGHLGRGARARKAEMTAVAA